MWRQTAFALAAVAAVISTARPLAAADKPGSVDVPQLFATTCGFCHEGGGRKPGKGPKLAGTARSDAFITDRIKNGKEGRMPAFEGALNNRQVKAIIAYIRGLKEDGQ
jgi:mono/diheme cytochrome c family protein